MHADKWYRRRYHLSTDPYSSYARPRRVPLEELVLLAKSGPFGAWLRKRETLWRLGALAERLKPGELS